MIKKKLLEDLKEILTAKADETIHGDDFYLFSKREIQGIIDVLEDSK